MEKPISPRKSEESMRNLGKSLTTTLDRLSVSYTDDGLPDAPVILFIHGFPLNKTMWNTQVEKLEEQYRVVTYDIRGHGESELGEEKFSIDQFTDDLINLLNGLEIKRVILCGLSMGGYIALNAIQKYHDRFDALVLCDTQCKADTPETREKRMSDIDFIKENGVEDYAEKSLEKLFMSASLEKRKDEVNFVKKMIEEMSVESLTRTLHALADRKETCNELSQIDVPVLVLMGEEDKITPPAKGQYIKNNIKDSELKIVAQAGHLSNLENPDQFNEHLKTFVDSIYGMDPKKRDKS